MLARIFHTDSAAACENLMDTASASNGSSGSMKHTAVIAIHHLPCHHQDSRRLTTNQYEISTLEPRFFLLAIVLLLLRSTLLVAQTTPTIATMNQDNLKQVQVIASQASEDYDKKNYTAAEKKYRQILSLSPYDVDTLNRLASVEIHLNKLEETEQLLRTSIQKKLDNPNAWLLLGMTYLQEQRIDEAFAALIQATLYDSKNARAHHYLGIVAGHKKWREISELSLRKAIELDPNYADAHFNLAIYYMQHNPPMIEVARRHYQRALDLGIPHDPTMDTIMNKSTL